MTALVLTRPARPRRLRAREPAAADRARPRLRLQRTLLTVTIVADRRRAGLPAGLAVPHERPHRRRTSPAATRSRCPREITSTTTRGPSRTGNLGLNIVNSLIVTLGSSVLIVVARHDGGLRAPGAGVPVQQARACACS